MKLSRSISPMSGMCCLEALHILFLVRPSASAVTANDSACIGVPLPLHVDVVFDNWAPYSYFSDTVTGYSADALALIAHLANFSFTIRPTPHDDFYTAVDIAELSGTYWMVLPERLSGTNARVSLPYISVNYYVLTPKPLKKETTLEEIMFSFMNPFQNFLWGMTVLLLLVTGWALCIIERGSGWDGFFGQHNGEGQFTGMSIAESCGTAMYLSLSSFTGAAAFEPKTILGRLIHISLSFVVLVAVAAYTANMAADLTIGKQTHQTIHGVSDFERYGLPLCVRTDQLHSKDLQPVQGLHPDTPYVELWKNHSEFMGLSKTMQYKHIFRSILQGTCYGFAMPDSEIKRIPFFMKDDKDGQKLACKMEVIGQAFNQRHGSFFVPGFYSRKNGCVLERLNYGISQFLLMGKERKALEEKWFESLPCVSTLDMDGSKGMSVKSFSGLYMIHASFLVLALAVRSVQALGRMRHWQWQSQPACTQQLPEDKHKPITTSVMIGRLEWGIVPEEVTDMFEAAGAHWEQFCQHCALQGGLGLLWDAGGRAAVVSAVDGFIAATPTNCFYRAMAGARLANWAENGESRRGLGLVQLHQQCVPADQNLPGLVELSRSHEGAEESLGDTMLNSHRSKNNPVIPENEAPRNPREQMRYLQEAAAISSMDKVETRSCEGLPSEGETLKRRIDDKPRAGPRKLLQEWSRQRQEQQQRCFAAESSCMECQERQEELNVEGSSSHQHVVLGDCVSLFRVDGRCLRAV